LAKESLPGGQNGVDRAKGELIMIDGENWGVSGMVGRPWHNNGESIMREAINGRLCENCQIEFFPPDDEVRRGGGRFCSRKCVNEWMSKRALECLLAKVASLEVELIALQNARRKLTQSGQDYEAKRFSAEENRLELQISELKRRADPRYRKMKRAKAIVAKARRMGKLTPKPCEICGNPDTQAHHEDYTKPLEVKWLCLHHHRRADFIRHCKERAALAEVKIIQ
jgi:hypothetical protein